jgi:putative nucleotidyltransferase with HDIG domain
VPKKGERDGRNAWLRVSRLPKESPQLVWTVCAFILVLAVFFVSLVPQRIRLKAGEVSPLNVKAPQELIDDAATESLKEERAKTVSEVYDSDPRVLADTQAEVASFRKKLADIAGSASVSTQEIMRSVRPFLSDDVTDSDTIATVAASPQTLDAACSKLDEALTEALAQGLSPENLAKARDEVRTSISRDKDIPDQMGRVLMSFVAKNLKPNLTFNQEETDKRIREALAQVEPVRIRRGQFIVREGEVVTEDQVAMLARLGMIGSRVRFSAVAGSAAMSLLVCGLIATYLRIHHPDTLSPAKVGLLASVVMLSVLAIKGVGAVSPFLVPAAGGVMLAATLFDRKFGAFFGACLTLVAATVTGFEIRFLPLCLAGSLGAALAIKPDWNRAHLLRAGFIVSGVHALTYLTLGLTGAIPLSDVLVWRDTLLVLANGPISAILAVGSLPLFEAAFGIITPLRLIELSNPESPLLHRLLLEAPGTYYHSIMVGNLAEAAAMAIGADSLLARVGAYYHDVGKIKRPYFFAENQVPGMDNPHDKMSPTLSATVITSHVKDGLELAAEHKVPAVIRDFIAEHHGTMLASFFYSKAYEKETKDNRGPEEWDFRYEGPRPATKEVAVVMLADGVEAATRSLSKPTPARMESVVRKIIHERLLDQQLDRSELTLRELDTVAETFTRVLSGVFHTRIEYPEKPPKQGQ